MCKIHIYSLLQHALCAFVATRFYSLDSFLTIEISFGFNHVPFSVSSVNNSDTDLINPFSLAFKSTPIVPVKLNSSCFANLLPKISSITTKSAFCSFARIRTSASPESKSVKKALESGF